MQPRFNIKVLRISEGCYRGVCDEIRELSVEGPTVWETLKAARIAVRQLRGPDEDSRN